MFPFVDFPKMQIHYLACNMSDIVSNEKVVFCAFKCWIKLWIKKPSDLILVTDKLWLTCLINSDAKVCFKYALKQKSIDKTHLNSRLAQMHLGGQLLAHEGIRIVRPFEHLLQRRQLGGAEGGAIASRFPWVAHWDSSSSAAAATSSCANGACNQGAIK